MKNLSIAHKFLVMLGSIGCLSGYLSIDSATAKPSFDLSQIQKVQSSKRLSQIQGQIISNYSEAASIACNTIIIKLDLETPRSISTEQFGKGTIYSAKPLTQTTATGSNLASGCSYQMSYPDSKLAATYAAGSPYYAMKARVSLKYGWLEGDATFSSMPSSHNISLKYGNLR
jgi:hypothetical protein